MRKFTDKQALDLYAKLGSVWRVADELGVCGQSVHDRLTLLKAVRPKNLWTADDDKLLQERYLDFRDAGRLRDLAVSLGRTKPFICRQAGRLGLTNPGHERRYARKWKGMSYDHAAAVFDAFKKSSLGVGQYCKSRGFDDLGFTTAMREHFPDEWEHVVEAKAPRTTKYRLGRQVEYAVRDDLKKRGYPIALRSPRSGGPVDILALRKGRQLLVQAKRSLAIGVKEWNTLFELAESVGAIAVLAGRPTGRGLQYFKMTGLKDGSKKRQPMEPFTP